jgi:multidrug efflux pump subunit AcrA (membrane-fusion protein)
MALAQPKSMLPATQQRKRQAAEAAITAQSAEAVAAGVAEAAAKAATEAAEAAAAELVSAESDTGLTGGDESVTLTRQQLNELQGASDRSVRAERDAQLARMEADEAKAALTASLQSRKEHTQADEPLDLGYTEADLALLPEEEETFGESKSFVLKLVRAECARLFKAYDARIAPRIAEARSMATEASDRVVKTAQKGFSGRVREKVADVSQLIAHANFKDFLDSVVPMTSMTYNTALNDAHEAENLQAAIDIFNAFRIKYGVKKPSAAGYNGAAPSKAAGETKEAPSSKHSMAERTKKGEDYRKGRIPKKEFDEYKTSFDAALEAGQVGD